MASSDTHAIAAIAEVKAGYWYCDNQFPTPVADIPSEFFTHLFAAFADVKLIGNDCKVTFPEAYEVQFSTFTLTVQKKNPLVQTLLSIGGGASTFASMARQVNTRQSFIHSSINLARSNDFHGLSLHWQYPSTEEERTNLGSLLNEWRAEVDLESKLTGNDPLLLVAAVYYRPQIHGDSFNYPVPEIASSLDWINLVAYDFFNPALSGNNTGPFAALHNGHIHEEDPRCADPGVRAWIHHGVPANKIVFGLPFYGAAWRLKDDTQRGIFAAADGLAAGLYINRSDGNILHNQIRYFIETHPGSEPVHSDDYVAYNDTQSITAKVKYAKENALLGYYAWHVGGDRQGTLSQAGLYEFNH
jgi:chitinase